MQPTVTTSKVQIEFTQNSQTNIPKVMCNSISKEIDWQRIHKEFKANNYYV